MKKYIFLYFFVFLSFFFIAKSQCDTQTYKEICIKKMPEYFVYSKTFNLSKKESESEQLLTQGKAYIVLADNQRTKVEIYRESASKKSLVKSGTGYVSYIVPSSGKYFFKFIFDEDDTDFCGAAILAFLR